MATTPFETPPRIPNRVDEDGYIKLTAKEYEELIRWLERLVKHIASIT